MPCHLRLRVLTLNQVTIGDQAKRDFKDRLYGEFARIGKAIASPHRSGDPRES